MGAGEGTERNLKQVEGEKQTNQLENQGDSIHSKEGREKGLEIPPTTTAAATDTPPSNHPEPAAGIPSIPFPSPSPFIRSSGLRRGSHYLP